MWPRCFATDRVASKCTPKTLTRLLKEVSWLPTLKWLSCETLPLLRRSRPSYRWRWQTGICQTNTTKTIQKPCQICQTCHANVKAGCCSPPKAADTLSEVKMDTWPLSALPWRQFRKSRRAVSVLWYARYAEIVGQQMAAKLMQHNLLQQFGKKWQVWHRTIVFRLFASMPVFGFLLLFFRRWVTTPSLKC